MSSCFKPGLEKGFLVFIFSGCRAWYMAKYSSVFFSHFPFAVSGFCRLLFGFSNMLLFKSQL